MNGVLGYFLQAGMVVKTVMLILLMASIASWALIFQRFWYFQDRKREFASFIRRFWKSADLSKLFTDLEGDEHQGLSAIFYNGFKEFSRISKYQETPALGSIERIMQISHAKEAQVLEQHLSFFASVGSIAPYIGLFGTVCGIMTTFQALGQAQQATIAMVAPGISEALVATALGLFTAIPAVLAYNHFSRKATHLLDCYDLFQEEFIAIIAEQSLETQKR